MKWATSWQSQQNSMWPQRRLRSDPHSLIRVFPVCLKKAMVLSYLQPCSLMWRICQCCSLQIFSPKNPKVSFCGRMWWNISKGTWPLQFAWGIRSLFQNNEENVIFTKTKGPFSWTRNLKGVLSVWTMKMAQIYSYWLVIIEVHL